MINSYTGAPFVDVAKVEDVAYKRANERDPQRQEDTMIHYHRYDDPCNIQKSPDCVILDDQHKYVAKGESKDGADTSK